MPVTNFDIQILMLFIMKKINLSILLKVLVFIFAVHTINAQSKPAVKKKKRSAAKLKTSLAASAKSQDFIE